MIVLRASPQCGGRVEEATQDAQERPRVETEVHVGFPDGHVEVCDDLSFSNEEAERKLSMFYYRAEMQCCEVLKTVINGQEYGC